MENSVKHSDPKNSSSASKTIFNAPIALPPTNLSQAEKIHVEHLKNQYEHLLILYEYHVQHMNRARSRQLFEGYRDLADTMARAIAQYEALLINAGVDME